MPLRKSTCLTPERLDAAVMRALGPTSRQPGQALLAAQPHRAHGDRPDAGRSQGSRGAAVEAAFAEEMDAIARDSCLAPEGKTWEMLLRQEAALDRAIDRKVRILLTMRKEHARECRGGSRTAPTEQEASPPGNESSDPGTGADTLSSVCDSGQDGQPRPSLRETQTPNGGGLRQPATDSPAEENAGEISKSAEQSENVIENKGPAAEGVAA